MINKAPSAATRRTDDGARGNIPDSLVGGRRGVTDSVGTPPSLLAMLRRTHRRRSPVPLWAVIALVLVALAAALIATLGDDPWLVRAAIAVLTAVVVVYARLLCWLRKRLRAADLRLSHTTSALARAERHGVREVFRRERRIAELCLRIDTLQQRLDAATTAGMYVATVLASIDRGGRVTLGYAVTDPADTPAEQPAVAEEQTDEPVVEHVAEEADARSVAALAIRPTEGPHVQIWPNVDDAPTVVDLFRPEDVRRAAGESGEERSA